MNKGVEAILLGVLLELLESNFLGHERRKIKDVSRREMKEGGWW